jgi:glyoxylase-like metal-dependent hydrolase (beta-lactamase superfamily II)
MPKATPTYAQITPHIYKLNLALAGGRLMVGVFLVREADGWVLVDAGAPGTVKTIMEQTLAQTGGALPKLLLLTHGHGDHGAGAQRIREEWKIPVAAHRDEIPYLIGPRWYNQIPTRFLPYKLTQMSAPALVGRNVQVPLEDGQRLGDLVIYHVPGHAPGLVALLHPGDRALICGDTFMNRNHKLSDPFPFFTYDMDLNRRSQARLAELDFDHLIVSHGEPILNTGRQAIRDWVARHEAARTKGRMAGLRRLLLGPGAE